MAAAKAQVAARAAGPPAVDAMAVDEPGAAGAGWRPTLASLSQPPTPSQVAAVEAGFRAPDADVLFTAFRVAFDAAKFGQLQPGTWLKDDVINMFIWLLRERNAVCGDCVWVAGTSFWAQLNNNTVEPGTLRVIESGYSYASVKMYTSVASRVKPRATQVDVFGQDLLLIPINYPGSHWALMVLDMKNKVTTYYDSLGAPHPGHAISAKLLRWLRDEWREKKGGELETSGWEVRTAPSTLPRQTNGFDCGVFMCVYMDFLAAGHVPTVSDFTQEDMPMFRNRIAASLLQSRLLETPEEVLTAAGLGSKAPGAR
jgi:sentrin-specific protease 1